MGVKILPYLPKAHHRYIQKGKFLLESLFVGAQQQQQQLQQQQQQ